MLRYKQKSKNKKESDRKKIGSQSISMIFHLFLILVIFIFSPELKKEVPLTKISVEFKYKTPSKKVKKSSKSFKKSKIKNKVKKYRKIKRVVKTGLFIRKGLKKKISLKKNRTIAGRRIVKKRLSNLLEVTEKLERRSNSSKVAKPLFSDLSFNRKKGMSNDLIIDVRSSRKKLNISSKLDVLETRIKNEKKVGKRSDEFEIGLLDYSAYTIMPEFLWKSNLVYPISARKRGSEGVVNLIINILENGDVGMVRLSKSPLDPELGNFLLKEAENWKFKPMYKDGIPLSGEVSVKVKYTLKNKEVATIISNE